ncbi:MAG: hypothetical protein K6F11_08180 [Lachnospiraceae bacterium]|nr:hypothetical protein [Lachnospiraceae bacterium]
MAKGFAQAVAAVTKQAHANAARCCMVWAALALREEGYGSKRIKRVLENIYKYAVTLNGKTTIEEQTEHIARVTGLRIVWKDGNKISIDDVEDWDEYEET